ncbi:uncharacterized protein FYW47_002624 [Aplochiton taeniatus]
MPPLQRQTMAMVSILFLLSSFHPSSAQVITGPSSSLKPLIESSPPPTKDTAQTWPVFPPSGGSEVPGKVTARDQLTDNYVSPTGVLEVGMNRGPQGESTGYLPFHVTAPSLSVSPSESLSSGAVQSLSTPSRPLTDTVGLALPSSASETQVATVGPTISTPTEQVTPPSMPLQPSQNMSRGPSHVPSTSSRPRTYISRLAPTVASREGQASTEEPPLPLPTTSSDQSSVTDLLASTEVEPVTANRAVDEAITEEQDVVDWQDIGSVSDPMPTVMRVEESPVALPTAGEEMAQFRPQAQTALSEGPSSKMDGTVETSPTVSLTLKPRVAALTTANRLSTTPAPDIRGSYVSILTVPTVRSAAAGTTLLLTTTTTTAEPRGRGRFGPTGHVPIPAQKNQSILLGRPRLPSSSPPSSTPSPPPDSASSNDTALRWNDLSRTLAFAWELHVYGSACLFLLLFAGAALGLALSPGLQCPNCGVLALANALLFLTGGTRAALFLVDPYGTRHVLPRPAFAALYNLALPLLVWAQAALALLAMQGAGVSVLPPALERPPLLAVLAVLQCTLLFAADLLSPALSPAVPVTLQILSLCWGLVLCLGFLCYVFPRLRCPSEPRPAGLEAVRDKTWTRGTKTGLILGRVLAVCALLGALCCGLHVHATLWLYGLLGNWRRLAVGWWLVHFWARLLELAWGFSLLLLGSWVFWRPWGTGGREEGGSGDGRAGGDAPSPGQSAGSNHRHTCWSKIVQSLTGKPCRKSESNGVGGGGGGGGGGGVAATGELPNNWAGQERSGADISKSLIRNQQPPAQQRCAKDSNHGRNQSGHSAERGVSDCSTGSLLRLQTLSAPLQRSVSGGLDQEKETGLSLYEFDLRPPSPINLSRSIDNALHREHLLHGGSLFQPLSPPSPSPGSGLNEGPWLRRNSDPQLLLSDSSEEASAQTESSVPLGGSMLSSVPSRQVTAPPTPSHQGNRWAGDGGASVPSSVSCPASLRPCRTSTVHLADEGGDDTRPFLTPDSDKERGRAGRKAGSRRSYLEVGQHDDSASVSSEIIDL